MNIELTLYEVSAVLAALSKLPYEHVSMLIPKIKQQAEEQLNADKEAV